ncbi:outer membrane beta-barrel protein [Sphingomonas sp. BK235]|uniref:outer membrane protein n=1 Tax=Sphingomonas sp. BK235 TaxID=2512131 RepID=UPI001053B405|nr:outer membrane beta-barrel protein [Sphingomonas sp. BK235]TCP36072.1 outer membrane immunogenic protein [Sphingomonas sp. BK235]
MNKLATAAFIAAAAAAAAALPATAQTFEGPYAGVQAGWSHADVGAAKTKAGPVDIDRSKDAGTAGVFAGYNYKVADRIVLSAEAGFSFGIDDAVTRSRNGTLASIDPEYSFDLGARAGYLVGDQTLLYVRGGYENLRAAVRSEGTSGSRYAKDTFDGWSVGGGVEQAVSDKVSVRVEYRYSDLGGDDTKFQRHQLLGGVAYHF